MNWQKVFKERMVAIQRLRRWYPSHGFDGIRFDICWDMITEHDELNIPVLTKHGFGRVLIVAFQSGYLCDRATYPVVLPMLSALVNHDFSLAKYLVPGAKMPWNDLAEHGEMGEPSSVTTQIVTPELSQFAYNFTSDSLVTKHLRYLGEPMSDVYDSDDSDEEEMEDEDGVDYDVDMEYNASSLARLDAVSFARSRLTRRRKATIPVHPDAHLALGHVLDNTSDLFATFSYHPAQDPITSALHLFFVSIFANHRDLYGAVPNCVPIPLPTVTSKSYDIEWLRRQARFKRRRRLSQAWQDEVQYVLNAGNLPSMDVSPSSVISSRRTSLIRLHESKLATSLSEFSSSVTNTNVASTDRVRYISEAQSIAGEWIGYYTFLDAEVSALLNNNGHIHRDMREIADEENWFDGPMRFTIRVVPHTPGEAGCGEDCLCETTSSPFSSGSGGTGCTSSKGDFSNLYTYHPFTRFEGNGTDNLGDFTLTGLVDDTESGQITWEKTYPHNGEVWEYTARFLGGDWETMRQFMPKSFGKQQEQVDMSKVFAKTARKDETDGQSDSAPGEQDGQKKQKYDDHEEKEAENREDDSDVSEEDEGMALPISHEVELSDHTRTVSALTLDPAGSRLISGSYDYDVKFWDFAGMNASFRPFRSIEAFPGNQIHELAYSNSGDCFLAISGSAKAKIFDRDGHEITEFLKGDPYIRDMRNTDGHVAALTFGGWHPHIKENFFTTSQDGTVRIWDMYNKRKQKSVIVHKSKVRGGRTSITTGAFSKDGKMIAGAAQDGTINIWPTDGPYLRPIHAIEKAHTPQTETSSIVFSYNNTTFVSRGGDDTVKVWDIRNLRNPQAEKTGLMTLNPEANVIFSPDERLIVTGTAAKKGEGFGQLVMMERNTLETVRSINVTKSSVVRVLWHAKINQIITGNGDGSMSIYYDPELSNKGAMLCITKPTKRRHIDDFEIDRPILTPHALPMFRDDQPKSMKRKREKTRLDPKSTKRPNLPVGGPGRGGRLGSSEQQQVLKGLMMDTTRGEDPREALLKYAKVAEEDPMWVNNVYKKTQPKPVFAEVREDDEETK
ncbi:hypothetical protein BZG36_01609 [Bifiguratus adelaidae]|uniref:Uncharacterized protein n=1 Tax=Bifiguratus adelaidae TaxID=1938954 RepID=A0A261Y4E1_9FUNG|nr:hypothetical protein BZG36_01609 [Bifiguratus adelaidae]